MIMESKREHPMASQNTIQVRTTFLGFAQPAIIETVTTSSNPSSPRWTATLDQITRKHAEKHGGWAGCGRGGKVRSVTVALANKATIE